MSEAEQIPPQNDKLPTQADGLRILVAIDNGVNKSTSKAFKQAMKRLDKGKDELFLVNCYSSWDYLNDEKNAGKLTLSSFEQVAKAQDVKVFTRQLESSNPQAALLDFIIKMEVDVVFIGEHAFTHPASEENVVFGLFSAFKKFVYGTN